MGGVPRIAGLKILPPERPGPTLQRPDGVNVAHGLVAVTFQKDAIPVPSLGQTIPKPDAAQVSALEPSVRPSQKLGDSADFLFRGPDVPRCPAAAIAALGALKREACPVPFLSSHCLGNPVRRKHKIAAAPNMLGISIARILSGPAVEDTPVYFLSGYRSSGNSRSIAFAERVAHLFRTSISLDPLHILGGVGLGT